VKWRDAGDVFPGQLNVVLEFGADLLTHRTDVGQRWMIAYLKGVRDYYATIVKKGSGWADVVSVLTRWTPVTDASLYPHMGFAYNDPNGQLNMDSLADQLRFAQDQGQLTGPLDVQQTVDTRFTDGRCKRSGATPHKARRVGALKSQVGWLAVSMWRPLCILRSRFRSSERCNTSP